MVSLVQSGGRDEWRESQLLHSQFFVGLSHVASVSDAGVR
jgi:hypothetical protein